MEAIKLLTENTLEQYIQAGSTNNPSLLRRLAKHSCDKVRLRVAENNYTTPDVLRDLAVDDNQDVRIAVAANPACLPEVRQLIADDSDVIVRHGLAQNIVTPKVLLEKLALDDNGWVRGEALKTLLILERSNIDEVGHRRAFNKRLLDTEIDIAS